MIYTAQFRSALPIRHALLRLKQIEKRYDKMDGNRREALDKKFEADLGGDFSTSIVVELTSRSLSMPSNGDLATLLSVNTAALLLPGGRMVFAIRFRRSEAKAEAVFPRILDGAPVIGPEQKEVVFALGHLSKDGFTPHFYRFAFKLEDMVYLGAREF
jgi:hypothetical protein